MLCRLFCCVPLAVLLLALTACSGENTPAAKAHASGNGNGSAPPGSPLFKVIRVDKDDPAPPSAGGVAADPIVIYDCRLVPFDKQDVPSRYDGVLDTIEVKEDQYVKAGQVLARLDARQASADLEMKKAKLVAARADYDAAKKTEVEMKRQSDRDADLAARNALAKADADISRLRWERAIADAISKDKGIDLAKQEEKVAGVTLELHDLKSKKSGLVRSIFKRDGEAVKNLETVLQVYNLDRLRVEGLTPQQNLPYLRKGMKVVLEPAQPQAAQQALRGHFGDVTAVAVSNDPKHPLIVSASEDSSVRLWDRASGREKQIYPHPAPVRAIACTPRGADANLCLTGAADGKARLYDLTRTSDQPVRELKGNHRGAITAVAFTPDGKFCASGGEDREIRVWDVATGEQRYALPAAHRGAITSLQFTPHQISGQAQLVSAGKGNNTLCVWKVGIDGAQLEKTIDRRSGDVPSLGVSADGKHVLFDDQGRSLRILSLPRGLTEAVLPPGAGNFTNFALFAPDGNLILTAGASEGRVQLWRGPSAQRVHEIRQLLGGERTSPSCAAFAPDGSFVVVGTRDRQVLVWPVPDPKECDREFSAKLTVVERMVDTSAGQVRVWAELENPRDAEDRPLLLPGGTVTMVIYPGK